MPLAVLYRSLSQPATQIEKYTLKYLDINFTLDIRFIAYHRRLSLGRRRNDFLKDEKSRRAEQ